MPYPTRKIGDIEVSAIGYGAMGISGFYGSVDSDEERFKVLDRAHELGITHWDSSDVYADSEELIGKWFRRTGKRNDVFLATKFGFVKGDTSKIRADRAYVHEAIESSLRRFGVSHIDLYYLHRIDPKVPIEETVHAMADLVKQGKVKYIGLSEPSSSALRRAHAIHPISAVQLEYSPFALDIEDPKIGLRETAKELGIPIVAYSPLGRGILAGKYTSAKDFESGDFRHTLPMLSEENTPKVLALANVISQIGKRHDATAGQVCLAWLLAQGPDVIPIPGTKRVKYLEENARAAYVKLTDEEVAAIRKATADTGAKAIPRYNEAWTNMAFQDSPLPTQK